MLCTIITYGTLTRFVVFVDFLTTASLATVINALGTLKVNTNKHYKRLQQKPSKSYLGIFAAAQFELRTTVVQLQLLFGIASQFLEFVFGDECFCLGTARSLHLFQLAIARLECQDFVNFNTNRRCISNNILLKPESWQCSYRSSSHPV